MTRTLLRIAAAGIGLSIIGAACGPAGSSGAVAPAATTAAVSATQSAAASSSSTQATTMTKAGDLRVALNLLLMDHVYNASQATGAALRGDDAGFTAAAATLDKNTVGLGDAVGSVYGDAARTSFLELWRKHIGFFVDYTMGAATKDQAKKDKAKTDLDGYRKDFDAFLSGANPNLPKGAVADLLVPHVSGLFAVIDAQAAKDPMVADKIKTAAAHSQKIADPLAGAIAKQFPDKLPGAAGKAADFRTALNLLLDEHVQITAIATGAALRGDDAGFKAAAATLDTNTVALSDAIGSVYGDAARATFLELWRKHIGFFVSYTVATAAGDTAGQSKAVADLDGYRKDFDAFLSGANPNLPKGAVAELLVPHVTGIAAFVNAQKAKDPTQYDKIETAASHSQKISDPLAEAIVKQFPAKF
jgi:hypothetical protein